MQLQNQLEEEERLTKQPMEVIASNSSSKKDASRLVDPADDELIKQASSPTQSDTPDEETSD